MPELLSTFPPNALTLTDYFSSSVLEVMKHNAQALVLGATGLDFTVDLVITEGHKHDAIESRLSWRQLQTYLFVNNVGGVVGASPDECLDALAVAETAETDLARVRLWVPTLEAPGIIPRVRVSCEANPGETGTLTLYFLELDGSSITSTTILVPQDTALDRAWVDGSPVDLSGLTVDVDFPARIPALVRVTGAVSDTSTPLALHELAFGVTP
jgi:hypothetical protein